MSLEYKPLRTIETEAERLANLEARVTSLEVRKSGGPGLPAYTEDHTQGIYSPASGVVGVLSEAGVTPLWVGGTSLRITAGVHVYRNGTLVVRTSASDEGFVFWPTGDNPRAAISLRAVNGSYRGEWRNDGTLRAGATHGIAYTFIEEPTLGFSRVAQGHMGWFIDGTNVLTLNFQDWYSNTTGGIAMRHAGGSAAAPTYSFAGDTDTGMYRHDVNTLSFSVWGGESLRIDSTHRTHIRTPTTTGSASNLYVGGSALNPILRSTSARRYKSNITPADHLAYINLEPVKFYRADDDRWFYGFIADDLADQDELIGEFGIDGQIENYDYRAVLAVLAAKVNRLEAEVLK